MFRTLNLVLIIVFLKNYHQFIDCSFKNKNDDNESIERKHSNWMMKNNDYNVNEQFLSNAMVQLNYNRYNYNHKQQHRQQHEPPPPKGSILSCSIQCFIHNDCHCIEINVQNGHCNIYGYLDKPRSNYKNNRTDLVYFTRDYFNNKNKKRVNLINNKSTKTNINNNDTTIQYKFKKPIYLTGISFLSSSLMKHKKMLSFMIFVYLIDDSDDLKLLHNNDDDNICFDSDIDINENDDKNNLKIKNKSNLQQYRKWINCQPCGLYGNVVIIQLKNDNNTMKSLIDWPLKSLRIYGY